MIRYCKTERSELGFPSCIGSDLSERPGSFHQRERAVFGQCPDAAGATDIAHSIMDASDLIEIRAQPGGPRASGSGPRS